jgi:ATPase subunit of ABC transporter with duplicated ATPase domains
MGIQPSGLDRHNRASLMRMLKSYVGTLIVVSHDTELLRNCIDTLWHIDNGKIHVFSGSYDNYIRETHNILDEITNNLDLETREHMINVLKSYPGALIVISHDEDFLKSIGVSDTVSLKYN